MADEQPTLPHVPTRFTVREIVRAANAQRPDRELRLIGNVIKRVRRNQPERS